MADNKRSVQATFDFCKEFVRSVNERIEKDPENTKLTKADLAPLTEPFNEVLDFAKAFLIRSHDQLYGTILMSMDTVIDYSTRALVDLDNDGLMFTLKINPLFIGNYNFSKFITVIIAEILRLIYDHMSIFAQKNSVRDMETHNLLEDGSNASIAGLMKRDIDLTRSGAGLNIPDDFYTVSDVNYETDMTVRDKETLEYYYAVLKKFKKKNSQNSASSKMQKDIQKNGTPQNCQMSAGGGQGQDSQSQNGQGQSQMPQNVPQNQHMKDGEVASPNNNKGNMAHNWEGKDPEKASESVKSMLHDALEAMDARSRGFIPASIMEQIEKMLAPPEISWKNVLRKFVGTIPTPYRHTRRRLNRLQPTRTDLCGRLPKRKVRIVIAIDTSGSMSDDDISYCMNEVFHIAKANETEITVIECDCEIGRVYIAKKPEEIQPKVTGRGKLCCLVI